MPTLTAALTDLFDAAWPHLALALCALAGHALALRALRRMFRASGQEFWGRACGLLAAPTRLAVLLLALQLGRAAALCMTLKTGP